MLLLCGTHTQTHAHTQYIECDYRGGLVAAVACLVCIFFVALAMRGARSVLNIAHIAVDVPPEAPGIQVAGGKKTRILESVFVLLYQQARKVL